MQQHCNSVNAENDMLRRELSNMRMETPHNNGAPAPAPAPAHATQAAPYHGDPYASSSRTELPPLRSISSNLANGPDSMAGVQYDTPRANGYRQERY